MSTLWCWTSGATVNLYDNVSQNFIKSVVWRSIDFWANQGLWESKAKKFTEVTTSVYTTVASNLRDVFLKHPSTQKPFSQKPKMNSTYWFITCLLFDHVVLSPINIIVGNMKNGFTALYFQLLNNSLIMGRKMKNKWTDSFFYQSVTVCIKVGSEIIMFS